MLSGLILFLTGLFAVLSIPCTIVAFILFIKYYKKDHNKKLLKQAKLFLVPIILLLVLLISFGVVAFFGEALGIN